jgi:outer membrane lipoprotein-sorting protein
MKLLSLLLPVTLPIVLTGSSFRASSAAPADWRATAATFDCDLFSRAAAPQQSADPVTLDAVLKKMDAVAATFRSAQAEFEWDIYQKVIDEIIDVETGTIYYRRNGKEVEMMAQVKQAGSSASSLKAEPKSVLYSGGKLRLYQPKVDQVTEVDLGQKHSDYEGYIVLGFGGSGQDLVKAFDVTLVGPETISGIATAKLQLIPKSEKVKNTYKQIFLWIDLDRGISVQQQLIEPQGDYKLAKYSAIQVNGKKIPDDVFKLKTTSKTQTISPKG